METAALRQLLKSLCSDAPWNYCVLWKLTHGNPMLLAWEDGYVENSKPAKTMDAMSHGVDDARAMLPSQVEVFASSSSSAEYPMGLVVAEMSNRQYSLGERAVGEAALTGNHLWFSLDDVFSDQCGTDLFPQYLEEWLLQFASGIKTILLVPVLPLGVLQLGSLDQVAENIDIVTDVKEKFSLLSSYGHSTNMLSNLFAGNSFHADALLEPTSTFSEYVKCPPMDATGNVKFENQNDLVVVSHVQPEKDNRSDWDPILSPSAVPSPYIPVVREPLSAVANNNLIKNELRADGVTHVSSPSDFANISELDLVESKLSELSSLLGELQAYPVDLGIFGALSGENISTHLAGEFTGGLSMAKIGCSTDQEDDVDSFLNFPGDCELHKALGPVLGSQTHLDFHNTSLWIDKFFDSASSACHRNIFDRDVPLGQVSSEDMMDAVVSEAFCYPDDTFNISRGFGVSGSSSEHFLAVPNPCEFGVSGNVDPTTAAGNLKSKMDLLFSRVQEESVSDTTKPRTGRKASTANKRRAKLGGGGNQKSRPRDRQLIQDRVKELRELVPAGEQCSIDGLLGKTVKHMLYLRSVTDQAQKLKQWSDQSRKIVPCKPLMSTGEAHPQNGASWALECLGEQEACPIRIEDLAHPGHLLIEMLCNEQVLFLEVAHVIHGSGLTILKGSIQKRGNNSWAHFIVEASKGFHRLDIFWPLMQLLQRKRNPIASKI